jgi:tetratricopeptide (TPR) repeat protein
MGWFDGCFPRRRIISDSDGAESSRTGSPQKPADVVRIAASDNEKRKKLIQVYYKSGEKHVQAGRYKEACDDFTQVITLDRKHANAFAYRGAAYLGLKQFNEALADLNHALEMDKNNIFARAYCGIVHQEMGQYREAWADFTKVRKLGYSRPWIDDEFKKLCQCIDSDIQKYEYYKSGEKHIRVGRYNEARDDFTRVIALNEECSWAFAYRGRAYLGLGQLDEALTDLNHVLKMDNKNIYALKLRGVVHRKMGQYKEAWADFTKVCARGYSRPWIVKELCWLILRSVWACVKVKDSDIQIDEVKRHRQQEKSNDKITCEETKCIDKYQKEFDLYQLELKTVQDYSNIVHEQWEQHKQNIMNRYKAVFADSKQVLDD